MTKHRKFIRLLIFSLVIILIGVVFRQTIVIRKLINENNSLKIANEQYVLKDFRFDAMMIEPISFSKNINEGDSFSGVVFMRAWNTKLMEPLIMISDSIDSNNNLLGKIDTLDTKEWGAIIKRKTYGFGKKTLFGKYIIGIDLINDPSSFDFSIDYEIIKKK